jgi:hypothetical protein
MRAGWILALSACLALAACAGQAIKDKMPAYIGQPSSVLIGKLGFPTRQDTVAGRKVYIWTTSNLVDGTNYGCTIRAIVDDQDVIMTWDYQGNEGGCAHYASTLR